MCLPLPPQILRDPEVCALLLDPDVRAVLEACRALQPTANDAAPGSGRAREALARRMREPEMAGKLRRLAAAGVVRLGIGLDEKYVGAYGKQ